MGEKKYYWLKLKADFFKSKEIKKLRRLAGGDTFTIIYLKMMLQSLKNGGKLYFDGVEDDFVSEIALEIDEDSDNVGLTIAFLQRCNLLEVVQIDEYMLTEVTEMTGFETDSAIRKRKSRSNKMVTNCDNVTPVSQIGHAEIEIEIEKDKEKEIEIEIEKDKEKDIEIEITHTPHTVSENSLKPKKRKEKKKAYGEYKHVKLTDSEYKRLVEDYGEKIVTDYIRKMDEWHEYRGAKEYKNCNLALRNWLSNDKVPKKGGEGSENNSGFNGGIL